MNESLNFSNIKKRKYSDLNDIYDKKVKYRKNSNGIRYTVNEDYNKINEISKDYNNFLFNNNIYITPVKKIKREISFTEYEVINLNSKIRNMSLSCCKNLDTLLFSSKFKARKCPSFTYTNIKLSDRPLTIPESPKLLTKIRSYRKLKYN